MSWYDGLHVFLYPGNDLSWTFFTSGCFEPNEFAFLSTVLKPGMTFIDIGANDGLYSLFAARRVGVQGTIVAVEPSQRELQRLRRNLGLNHIENVRVSEVAVSDRRGEARLLVAGRGHEGHNTLGDFVYNSGLLRSEKVRIVPLDDLLKEHGVTRVDVIKMDAEGGEFAALHGARHTIERHHPLLLIELNDAALCKQGSSSELVRNLLDSWGYQLHIFDPATGRPVPGQAASGQDQNIVAVHRSGPFLPNDGQGR